MKWRSGFEARSACYERSEKAIGSIDRAASMRSLVELARHLTSIPETDLAILHEAAEEEVRRLEGKYEILDGADALAFAMEKGFETFRNYMLSLSDDAFLTHKTKPFYLQEGKTQAEWLTETLTHIYHHRAQLFQYEKALGYEVNMFDLYL